METGPDVYDSLECNRKWTPMKQMQARKKVKDHGPAKVDKYYALQPPLNYPISVELPIVQRVV